MVEKSWFSFTDPETGREYRFSDASEFLEFSTELREAYEWVQKTSRRNNSPRSLAQKLSQHLDQLYSLALQEGASRTPDPSVIIVAFRQNIVQPKIPLPHSPTGKFLAELAEDNPQQAAAALALLTGLGALEYNNYDHMRGIIQLSNFEDGISKRSVSGVKRSLEALARKHQEIINSQVAAGQQQVALFQRERARTQGIVSKSFWAFRRINRNQRLATKEAADDAIRSIQATENTYQELMRLKASVQYWREKASQHETNAKNRQTALIKFAICSVVGLLVMYVVLATGYVYALEKTNASSLVFAFGAVGLVLTTGAIWTARVLTRLFLSEFHLKIDAEERAVMAETYLALTNEEVVSETERTLILAPLFRPTSDGLVKDDAAPEFSLASYLSK